MTTEERLNISNAMVSRGYDSQSINEAFMAADGLRESGYNEETVEALFESYLEDGTVIDGSFTIEKLMMAVDPDQAWSDFWEDTNA